MHISWLHKGLLLGLLVFLPYLGISQSSEQKVLEAKRARIQKEIKEMNRLLFQEKKEKGNVLDQLDALDQKINKSQELIKVTNQQANLLNRQINANVRKISKLREELKALKEEYATLIQNSYQNKTDENRIMFLLSAENFFQAFKRLQYIKQYTKYRKNQGEQIVARTQELTDLNKDLVAQRKIKDQLVQENTQVKNQLAKEVASQKDLLKSIRSNESKYAKIISDKQKESKRIDREIDRLIKSAIASSNKKTGGKSSSKFELTPEAKLIANNFSANKGKLIWPVEKGVKSQGYGLYADKLYPGIKHQNNGVTITTDKGEKARAIFEGEVIEIMSLRTGQKGVYVRHGNYISMYFNLASVYVKKGDKVKVKESIGEIYTNALNNETKLKFYLYQNTVKLNPEQWIYQM